jgi:hypothetical protein
MELLRDQAIVRVKIFLSGPLRRTALCCLNGVACVPIQAIEAVPEAKAGDPHRIQHSWALNLDLAPWCQV